MVVIEHERETRRVGRWLFVAALSLYVFTAGGSLTTSDALGTFEVAANIVDHHNVTTNGDTLGLEAHRGVDGRFYAPFGLAQSLYDIPFYVLGKTLPLHVGKSTTVPKAAVAMGQTLIVAFVVWQIFHLALTVTGDLRAALGASITCAVGSLLWPYADFGFNQPLATATLLAGTSAAIAGVRAENRRDLAIAGAWLAGSLLTRHEMLLGALPVTAWVACAGAPTARVRRMRLLALLPGILAGLIVWLIYNAVRFGNPLESGYLHDPVPGFGGPIAEGLLGLMFSPGASIFLYSPFTVLGVAGLWQLVKQDRAVGLLFAGLVGIFIAFYATLGGWMGGRAYGSRYLLVVLPYFGVGWAVWLHHAGPRVRRSTFALMTAAGIVLQVPGVVVDYSKVSQRDAVERGSGMTLAERQWSWGSTLLAQDAAAGWHAVPQNMRYLANRDPLPAIAAPAAEDDHSFAQQFSFSIDFWWLYLFYMGVLPRAGVAAIVLAFAVWIGWCARQLQRAAAVVTADGLR
jgi:hypothetical protein